MSRTGRTLTLILAATVALTTAGCSNPDAQSIGQTQTTNAPQQNAGEPAAPAPATAANQAPADVQSTPRGTLALFAQLYINWGYRTLTKTQRTLASMAVGAARLAEQQAAATSAGDSTIQQGKIENRGTVISIGRDEAQPGVWAIVTREQTSGGGQYEGLPASYHITLARVQHVAGGWAVNEWLPQS